jgi:hypothetical protein
LAGYANRVITLRFPDLSDDPDTDPIWVTIRNPRLVPPAELRPKGGIDENDEESMMAATNETMSRLIVGWRVYDAAAPVELDENGHEVGDQPLLGMPVTPEAVAKLPMEIINRIGEEIQEAADPQKGPSAPTP